MNYHRLHWIAEQHHASVGFKELDFGTVGIDEAAWRGPLDRALQAFPAEASLWDESNAVVLNVDDAPSNILPFRWNSQPL